MSYGVALLDGQGRVVHANKRAERIWRAADGLRSEGGHLCVVEPRGQLAWVAALRTTLADGGSVTHFSEHLQVPRGSGDGGYLMQLPRLPENSRFGPLPTQARVIVFITDAEQVLLPKRKR